MIPTNSSGTTNGCDNISSNCVIWQGPDITCIDLCSGDTISEVTFKLATKVCKLITDGVAANPSLVGLDLKCLNIVGVTPTTLVPVLQEMVDSICRNTASGGGRSNTTTLPIMTLPACLQYNNKEGNPVTSLPLDQFATLIANQVCTNLASINLINSTLTSYSSRLDVLEACVLPCSGGVVEAQIVPTCVSNIGTLTNVSVVVLALESAFCAFRSAVGLVSAINGAVSQSGLTGSSKQLAASTGTYSGITGWNNNPNTLAESVQNAWVVIDDMYAAITSVQNNCCPGGCESVVFGYTTANTLTSGFITDVVFNFIPSSIPSTFTDSSGYSQITITDALGASINQVVSVSSLQNNTTGISINTGSLNTFQNLSVSVDFRVTDGSDTCESNSASVISGIVPCPNTTITSITATGFTLNIANVLGTTAVYTIDILDPSNVVVATYTQNSPSGNFAHAFTGLIANTAYNIRTTIVIQGATKICNLIPVSTQAAGSPCSAGLDVAFILDYSVSMEPSVKVLKSAMGGVTTTIANQVGGNNYRLGLVTVDEDTSELPNYAACTDYTSLPASQKISNTGSAGTNQYYTAWEMFATNNKTSFESTFAKLNGGVVGGAGCIQMGDGAGSAEPMDIAIENVVGANNFVGAYNSNIAKYVLAFTDQLPSGEGNAMSSTVYARILSLITTCNNKGIKVFVFGAGVNLTWDNGGTISPAIYPWRELATQTSGGYFANIDQPTIQNAIINGCA